jgi:hypothetical protein
VVIAPSALTLWFLGLACSPRAESDRYEVDSSVLAVPVESDTDTDTDSDSDTDSDTDTDADTDADTDTPFDCKSGVPPLPYDSRIIEGSVAGEDVEIDNDGYIVGSDRHNLYRTDAAGVSELIVPNTWNPQAIVALPTDDLVLYQEDGKLERIDPDGNRSTISTGIYIPYGDANAAGLIYASWFEYGVGGHLVRIDPFAETVDEILEWEDDFAWGIAFDEDYTALYVSVVQAFDGYLEGTSRLYKVSLDASGDVDGDPELFVEFSGGTTWTEGLAVDVCGNVYASLGRKIVRVSKDGKSIDEIWESDETSWIGRTISGLAFGRKGAGGTDPMKLYASNPYDKVAIEIDVGVYGKSAW